MGCSLGMGHSGPEHPCQCRDQGFYFLTIPRSCLLETLAPAALLREEPWDGTVLQRELVGKGVI